MRASRAKEHGDSLRLHAFASAGSTLELLSGWVMPVQLAALVVFLALLGSCTRDGPASPADYLQVDISTGPTSLDPRIATDAISSRIDELIYDPMVKLDGSGQPRADLAERIERPDPTRLIFHLRRGVRFSNGGQLTRALSFTPLIRFATLRAIRRKPRGSARWNQSRCAMITR
jgi:MarR-like DNA-binding transcriptional regulator SgrR of sgrS sRNA